MGISGVRVNAVAPGYVLTPMVADLISSGKLDENLMRRTLGRLASPNEIAEVILFSLNYILYKRRYYTGRWWIYGHGAAGPAIEIE